MVAAARIYNFILVIILLGCIGTSLSAGGMQEDPLEKAQELIDAKLYNEAIVILSDVMRNDPKRFDEAQQLVTEIQKIRGEYNEKYSELIDIYHQEELDLDKAYDIFEELEEMDKSPNKNTVEAFERAKATAVFLYNKKQFEDIMERALALLDEGSYWEAAVTYLEGFEIYREEFEQKAYGNIVINGIANAREQLREAASSFQESREDIVSFFSQSNNLLGRDDLEAFRREFESYEETIYAIAEYRKEVFTLARYIRGLGNELQESAGEEEFHLSYLYLLSMGRRESNETEGIIGAIDLLYSDYIPRLSGELTSVFTEKLAKGKENFAEGRIDEAGELLRRALAYGRLLEDNYVLWETRMYVDDSYNMVRNAYSIAREKLPEFILHQTRMGGIEAYLSVSDGVEGLLRIDGSIADMEELPRAEEARRTVLSEREKIARELAAWEADLNRTRNIDESFEEDYSPARAEAEDIFEKLSAYVDYGIQTEQKAVVRIAELRYDPLVALYNENSTVSREGERRLTGYEETVGEGEAEATITLKDPIGAKERFEEVLTNLTPLREDFNEVVTYLEDQDPYILKSDDVEREISFGKDYIQEINNLYDRLTRLTSRAQEDILLAERYEEEGYYRIAQARLELQRESFEEARDQLRMAGERFDLSLGVQDDPELREERDNLIAELSDEINTTQNNVIVAEVRELIETAKNYYTQEQYDLAERNLLRAQSRWAITHVDSKPEIDYWLQIVRVALYVQSGREIRETDPLFAEMNQLLNLARENYLEGKRLAEMGRQEEAVDFFEEAEKNILYVKIPFPLNKEASVLSLRILQYKNPGDFDELFRKKFNEAAAQIQTNPQQAYIDLKDLAAIRPDYPGIQNAIYQTEIKLGMRIPPPDPAKQRQSDDLYNRALQIVQGGVRAQYPIALEYLNQALKLTPDSQKVTTLLDRVEAEVGGRTTTVLSNEAQQQYRLAEEKYIEGNYYEALRIVNNLLKDKQSSQYPPLLELKRRIESKI